MNAVGKLFSQPGFYFAKDYFIDVRRDIVGRMWTPGPAATVLDLGCGDGRVGLQFCGRVAGVTLVDGSPAMLARARARVPPGTITAVSVVESDVMAFSTRVPADLVLCLGVLPHLPDPRAALRRLSELVVPGGTVIVHLTDADQGLGALSWWYAHRRRQVVSGERHWLHRLTLKQLVADAAHVGLDVVEVQRCTFAVPGVGRLPNRWLLAWERRVVRSAWLSRWGADALVCFRRHA